MSKLRRLLSGERGVVAVEFALFLPLFLMLVFSIIELGGAWYTKQLLVHASREGARLGSLYSDGSTVDVAATVQSRLTQSGYSGQTTITVTGASGAAGDDVQVTVTTPYNFPVLGALVSGLTGSITLSSTTVMRHE